MLNIKFEQIPIKTGFLLIFKVAQKSDKSPCTIVQGHWPNFVKIEKERIFHFYIFSDTCTCSYVEYKV